MVPKNKTKPATLEQHKNSKRVPTTPKKSPELETRLD